LHIGATERAASAAKAARVLAASIAATEEERDEKDELRATSGGSAAVDSVGAAVGSVPSGDGRVSLTASPILSGSMASHAPPSGAISGREGYHALLLVEFTEGPPPPLFETTFFPFLPSMAAAAGPLPSRNFANMPH